MMFANSNLNIAREPYGFGQDPIVTTTLAIGKFGLDVFNSLMAKKEATKMRRLQRAIAQQQLELQKRALEIEEEHQKRITSMEEKRLNAWIATELAKAEALSKAPPISSAGAVRLEPDLVRTMAETIPLSSGARGFYYQLPEPDIKEKSIMEKVGLPKSIAGIRTEYILAIGGTLLLLILMRTGEAYHG